MICPNCGQAIDFGRIVPDYSHEEKNEMSDAQRYMQMCLDNGNALAADGWHKIMERIEAKAKARMWSEIVKRIEGTVNEMLLA